MPPDNTGYMIAAYVVAGVVYAGYAWSLWARSGRADAAARRPDT